MVSAKLYHRSVADYRRVEVNSFASESWTYFYKKANGFEKDSQRRVGQSESMPIAHSWLALAAKQTQLTVYLFVCSCSTLKAYCVIFFSTCLITFLSAVKWSKRVGIVVSGFGECLHCHSNVTLNIEKSKVNRKYETLSPLSHSFLLSSPKLMLTQTRKNRATKSWQRWVGW